MVAVGLDAPHRPSLGAEDRAFVVRVRHDYLSAGAERMRVMAASQALVVGGFRAVEVDGLEG